MGLRFKRNIKIGKEAKLNIGKKGISTTIGTKGLHYTMHSSGKKTKSAGIPGTGLSYVSTTVPEDRPVKTERSQRDRLKAKKIWSWIGCGFFAVSALSILSSGAIIPILAFALLALLVSPLRNRIMGYLPDSINNRSSIIIICVILLVAAIAFYPSQDKSTTQSVDSTAVSESSGENTEDSMMRGITPAVLLENSSAKESKEESFELIVVENSENIERSIQTEDVISNENSILIESSQEASYQPEQAVIITEESTAEIAAVSESSVESVYELETTEKQAEEASEEVIEEPTKEVMEEPIEEPIEETKEVVTEEPTPASEPDPVKEEGETLIVYETGSEDTGAPEKGPAQEPLEGRIVYITNTGSKYHEAWCSSLKNSCIPISYDEAVERGYEPCKRCH